MDLAEQTHFYTFAHITRLNNQTHKRKNAHEQTKQTNKLEFTSCLSIKPAYKPTSLSNGFEKKQKTYRFSCLFYLLSS